MTDERLWDALAGAHSTLVGHVARSTRTVRGEPWLVLRNEANGVHVRVNASLWSLLQRLDGRASVAVHLEALDRQTGVPSDATRRQALATGLATLERAGLLRSNGRPEGDAADGSSSCASSSAQAIGEAALRRSRQHAAARKTRRRARWSNPLLLRWPLHDPDRLLDRLEPLWRRRPARTTGIVTMLAAIVLLGAIGLAFVQADELTAAFGAFVATPSRWWTALLVWPLLKGCHEAAHAFAVRRFGGRVHELGIALLVFMPMPYVDASDASLFTRRRDRMLVGGAGILAELLIAALALWVWSAIEAGVVRQTLFALVLTGSVSSLLFNANPLLRFDGYHLMQDLIDIPNLGPRASAWWLAGGRRALGLPVGTHTLTAVGERGWLAGYGAASFAYRYLIVAAIALWLLESVPLVGVVLALLAVWPLIVRPIVRLLRWLLSAAELDGRRKRTFLHVGSAVALVFGVLVLLPLPSSTRVEGIVSLPAGAEITAPEAGEILHVAPLAGQSVPSGSWLVTIGAPGLRDEAGELAARIEMLEVRRRESIGDDATEAHLLVAEIASASRRAQELAARIESLELHAERRGRFVPSPTTLVVGTHVVRGATLGHLVGKGEPQVRAVLREIDAGRLLDGVIATHVRLAEAPGESLAATLLREMPAGEHRLPSAALARRDGSTAPAGRHAGIAVASVDERLETVDPVFHVEIGLPTKARISGLGGRAFVTFRHSPEPLMRRWWRGTRQLFLERLAV